MRNEEYLRGLQLLDIECPCRECGNYIVWDNSKIHPYVRNKSKFITGRTHLLTKTVNNHVYNLQVCQDCFENKFHKKSQFNVLSEETKWAFGVSDEDYKAARKSYAMTLENMIKKYGEAKGKEMWENYCRKQAETNTYEYKKQKYGWTEEQFKQYNKSRAVTLNNLIKRHGEAKGKEMWENYCRKQAETKSWEYMVEHYGLEKAREINTKKAQAGCNFYSQASQELFDKLSKKIPHKCMYHDNGGEYSVRLSDRLCHLDFYIPDLKICVEYNGSIFHADPRLFEDSQCCNPYRPNLTAREIRENDNKRYRLLEEEHGIKTIIIWELDYNDDFDIDKLVDQILTE